MRLSVNDIDSALFSSLPTLQRREGTPKPKTQEYYYKDVVCAFDIETTRYKIGEKKISKTVVKDEEISLMYIWQFQIGLDVTIMGRTWDEFMRLINMIDAGLYPDERLVVLCHNLSYEFQFLRDPAILGPYIDEESVFLLASRKVLKFLAVQGKIEFRCSYIHSNMSLDEYTSKFNVKHKKLSGEEFNYDKKRFPWSPMSDRELEYCASDVIGLVEAYTKEMEIDGDDLYTCPLTATGYVRRDVKAAMSEAYKKKDLPFQWLEERKPDYETYKLLHTAFRGGNTHANRFNANKRITAEQIGFLISEYDRSSSYPDVQLNGLFPISKFSKPAVINKTNFENCLQNGYAVVARLELDKVVLKGNHIKVPYLSKSNCEGWKRGEIVEDNGRIISAAKLILCVTEIDLGIIFSQYYIDKYRPLDFRVASKGSLPECIKETIRKYYRLKTKLKGDELNAIQYMKAKNKLNSIYGNSAQNGGKMNVLYRNGEYYDGFYNRKTKEDSFYIPVEPNEQITKEEAYKMNRERQDEITREIYENTNTSLPYQIGCWTTCLARAELQRMIDICGENFLYCDTDAVYFVDDGSVSFEEYNKEKIAASTASGAYADDARGRRHYMGVAEAEHNKDIIEFKTLGAKKYIYITADGNLHVTTSGVVKSKAPAEIMRNYDPDKMKSPLDVYAPGFTFYDAGGTEIEYIDSPTGNIEVDGRMLYVGTCAVIRDSTYTLSLTGDYSDIIDGPGFEDWGNVVIRILTNRNVNPEIFM